MTVQHIMLRDMSSRLYHFQGVSIHLYVGLKFELKRPFIFAVDLNGALVLTFTSCGRISEYLAERNTEVFGHLGLSCAVGQEEKLVVAYVKLADVFGFLKLTDFKTIHGLFLRLILEPIEIQLLDSLSVEPSSDLHRIHLRQAHVLTQVGFRCGYC